MVVALAAVALGANAGWETKLADLSDPVFTDRFSQQAVLEQPIPTPRKSKIAFLALTRSDDAGAVEFRFAKPPVRLDIGSWCLSSEMPSPTSSLAASVSMV